jgi:hypothetical protein
VTLDLATIPGDAELAEREFAAQHEGLKRLRQMQSALEESSVGKAFGGRSSY